MLYYNQKERDRQIEREDKTMKREDLLKKLEELENRLFLINMIDRWTNEDRKNLREVEREIAEVKAALA